MKKQTIELRFLSDKFLKWVKINFTLTPIISVGSNGNAGSKPFVNGLAALKSLDSNNDNQFTRLGIARRSAYCAE